MRLQQLNPKKGDVINIKFKSINQIMQEKTANMAWHDIVEYYQIESNVKAYVTGGHFLVDGAITTDEDHKDDPYITVKNHLDHNYEFTIHESVIEKIEVVDAAEMFVSNSLKIVVVRIGYEMYINGQPMIWNEEAHKTFDSKYDNHNRKLISMFEDFISDLAVRDTFNIGPEER